MKLFLCGLLFLLTCSVFAQDSGYNTPIYQANPLCPLAIELSAGDGSLEYHLRFDQTVIAQGALAPFEAATMQLSLTDQWYVLLIEWKGPGDYTIDTSLKCDESDQMGEERVIEQNILREHADVFAQFFDRIFNIP